MVRRVLLAGAVLFLTLLLVPACGTENKNTGKGSTLPSEEGAKPVGSGRAG